MYLEGLPTYFNNAICIINPISTTHICILRKLCECGENAYCEGCGIGRGSSPCSCRRAKVAANASKGNKMLKTMENDKHKLAKDNIKFPLKYDGYGQYIFDGDGNIFAQVRGYGKLRYREQPEKIQDAIGEFIVDTLNSANR